MQDLTLIAIPLVLGAVFASALVWFARWSTPGSRKVLAYGLIVTALVYVGFAVRAQNATAWLGVEMTGVAIYRSMAVFSLIGSPWWLAAGRVAHPLWDIQFHYVGTGSAFTPEWYPLFCLSFDLVVAAYVAYAVLLGNDPSLRRPVAEPMEPPAKSPERSLARRPVGRKTRRGRAA